MRTTRFDLEPGVLPKCNEKEKVVIGYELIILDPSSSVFKITL